jgi:flagellar assembly factor FliW
MTVKIQSEKLGEFETTPDCVIEFPEGLPGLDCSQRFALCLHKEGSPFRWLQSLDREDLTLLVVDPWRIWPSYSPRLSQADSDALNITEESLRLLYAIVSVPAGNPEGMTVNLAAPLLINAETRQGRQVVLLNEDLSIRHRVLDLLRATGRELAQAA